ncbi:MAG: hypothetical protein CVV02_05630 [Firmicutes bacterium HGW-Firmicutes-7]|nr:MAG: hypothetical protein CVV02_05630 [Firmicutes bacterium HGW-Firmicutes-7]
MVINGNLLNFQQDVANINIIEKPNYNSRVEDNLNFTVIDDAYSADISQEGIEKLFESRLIAINSSEGNEIQEYVERYMEIRKDIESNNNNQEYYIQQLDKVFDKVIDEAATTSVNKINKFLNGYLSEDAERFNIDENQFKGTYIGLANRLKDLYLNGENEQKIEGEIQTYFKNQPNFKTYSDFKLTIEIGNYAHALQSDIVKAGRNILSTNPKEIIHDTPKYNGLINEISRVTNSLNAWQMLSEKIDKSTLHKELKTAMKSAYERTSKRINKVSENAALYGNLLEEYKRLDERLRKLKSIYEKHNNTADEFNKQHNIERAGQSLVKASEIYKQMAEIEAKKMNLEAKMSKIQNELNEQIEEIEQNI